MSVNILMPAISPSMTSGKLVRWHVEPGTRVRQGDILAELETDKAAMDIEAPADGVLETILVPGGTADVPVETPIGILASGAAEPAVEPDLAPAPDVAPAPAPVAEPAPASAVDPDAPPRRISPLARRLAREMGVETDGLRGTGPKGRILAADIREAAERPAPTPVPAPAIAPVAAPAPQAVPAGEVEPHTAMRRTIAQRLVEAKQTVPHFYLEVRCEADALLALRKELNAALAASGSDAKLTVNDLVMKAYALAIARTPDAMVTWNEAGLVRHTSVDIGLAVALEGGLITPILRDAARLSPGALSQAARDAIARARAGRLMPEEYSGGLAGLSNLGMYGVSAFSAIINPPQSMNLAVGTTETELALRDGQAVEVQRLRLTLSVDHRAIDGAVGAQLLQQLKTLIETPLLLAS
ncbi:dihydrolipoamide acetyltransferase family protein [Stappia indica]|uniref:Dihydrolipoamide acetyltransferase component of pyruvate dehydrogenase complex n=1 Tax=Stappia indica TaxID=538381 RepID=A0A285TDB7_9HYPH|nr:dihydrolipoamide acetyltransferase family protein [Stappia indica]SOC20234.1 pyruvate dehydrogenase E2 component (dihydrolipoamide acetyltransferase) [Stappia indica]